MRRMQRIVMLATFAVVVPVLAGCSSFDPDSFDMFGLTEKKKLPGERRDVFPEGVPGVTSGVPAQYRVGANQMAPDAAMTPTEPPPPVAAAPAPPPRARATSTPKPRRTVAAKPRPAAAAPVQQATEAPAQQQAQPAPAPSAWPAPATSSGGTAAWPAPPPSGSFQR